MTVAELISSLEKYPKDYEIVLSRDSEGNGYSPCYQVDSAKYVAEESWYGYILHEDDCEDEEFAEEYKTAKDVVVLWPM